MKVLVTGGTGAVGEELVRALSARGDSVRLLVHVRPPSELPPNVQPVTGAVEDAQVVRRAAEGIDVIFHLAAKLHIANPEASLRSAYERVNVDGTRRVIDAARERGVGRVVFFSTIAVYGPTDGVRVLDEDAPRRPDSLYSESKCAAEDAVREFGSSGVVLRLASIYGPAMKGNYARLLRAVGRGLFLPIGEGINRRTLVYVTDAVAAALLAADHPAASGKTFNVSDGAIHRFGEILRAMYAAVGRPHPRGRISVTPLRVVAGAAARLRPLLGTRALAPQRALDKLLEDVAVSGDRFGRVLGFQPAVDLGEGWRRTVRGEA